MLHPHRLVLATTAAAALLLTACGSGTPASPSVSASASPSVSVTPTASATPTSSVVVSNSIDSIKVTGERLKAPKVTFKAPFAIDETRTRVEVAGKGAKAVETGFVTVHYYGVNGRTGKSFDESYSRKQTVTFPLNQVIEGFKKGLTGQAEGSRVLIVMPGSDGYDASGGSSDGSIAVGDTLLFVVDVVDVSLTEPSGKAITPAAGLPTVTPGTGKPTITIPAGAPAPTKLAAQTLIQGTGAKVAKTDTILARYVGVSWKTGQVIDDQFDTPSSGLLSSTIPGWQSGLVGKTVGSRVMLVLPPKEGFPEGSNNPPVEAGDTVVYVIDLLFAYSA